MRSLFILALFATLSILSTAQAETVNCTAITSLPATINSQGVFCLTGDLTTAAISGNAITINADDVTLDLNGWKLGGQGAGAGTTAVGIYSAAKNATIKNGSVLGFYQGVSLDGSRGKIQNIFAKGNTFVGVRASGGNSVIDSNRVLRTGGSTVATNAIGISVTGARAAVTNNIVSSLSAAENGLEWGIYLGADADYSTAISNIVSDDSLPVGAAESSGIRVGKSAGAALVENIITNFDNCVDFVSPATGIYARTVAVDCTAPFTGGTAGSNNDSN